MLKIGLCGAGFMGTMHAACYANIPGVKVVAVADVRKDFAEKVAADHGAERYARASDLIAKADVDAVDICLPTYLHADHVVQAAARGLDCMCEKPLALNTAEADRIVKAVRKAKIKFMVGHVIRFWPEYVVLKETIEKKKLGALKMLFLTRFGGRPAGWQNWFHKQDLCGGGALDMHIHDSDYVLYLLGMPKTLDASGAFIKGGLDRVTVNYHYPGVAVTAAGGWWPGGEPFEMAFRAVFDKGVLTYSSNSSPLTLHTPGKDPQPVNVPQPKTSKVEAGGNISSLGGYFNEVNYFVECLKRNEQPEIVTPETARDAVKLVEREIASAKKNQSL